MKVWNYVVLSACLMTLFQLAGIDTSSTWIVSKFGLTNLTSIDASVIWNKLTLLFAIGIGGAIAIGAFTKSSPVYAIKAGIIMTFLANLVFDFIFILSKLSGWTFGIASIIIVPLIAGYFIAVIEFWEGRD